MLQVDFEPGAENTSTQMLGNISEMGKPKHTSTQRLDKARKEKVADEMNHVWTEPRRTEAVEKPLYQYVYNIHNGDHHRMLVGSEAPHEGVLTEEEHQAVAIRGADEPAGLRVSLEGNIASGKNCLDCPKIIKCNCNRKEYIRLLDR